jgi:hypothetical protein
MDMVREAAWLPPRGNRRPGGPGNRWVREFNYEAFKTGVEDHLIIIPQIGAISVGGLTFSQAERAITNRLGAHLKRFEVHVAMARLRTIKVYVVGEVIRPGAYEISSLATVSNAMYAACGPARSGSLRQVRLIRESQVVAEVDFYQFLMAGDRRNDARLQSGDVIVVPPLGPGRDQRRRETGCHLRAETRASVNRPPAVGRRADPCGQSPAMPTLPPRFGERSHHP